MLALEELGGKDLEEALSYPDPCIFASLVVVMVGRLVVSWSEQGGVHLRRGS